MVLAAAPIEKARPGMGGMEAALLTDMEKRIGYYRRLAANLEEKIDSLQKSAARRPATPLFGSNEINPDFLKNMGAQKAIGKQMEIYRKELATLESLLRPMETAKKEMESVGRIPKDAYLKDGTLNGYHASVQKILENAALFSAAEAYANAATWKLAAADNLETRISAEGRARFTVNEISDIAARGAAYLGVLERQMEKLLKKGGAKRDYADPKDRKRLAETFGEVGRLLKEAGGEAARGNLDGAGVLVRKAAKLQLEADESYNKVITEALNAQHVYEKGTWYDRFKYAAAPGVDVAAAAAPVVGGLLGAAAGGLQGALAGAKAGADFSAFWWYYRGIDGAATAAANGRAFSLECAESVGLALLSATHLPAGRFRWLKPAGEAMGYGLAGSMAYHAGSELADAWKRNWFFTAGQRNQFLFYGAVITFSAGSIVPMKVADRKLGPEFETFRGAFRKGSILGEKERWLKLAEYLNVAGDKGAAETVRGLLDAMEKRANRPLPKRLGGIRMTDAVKPEMLEMSLSVLDGALGKSLERMNKKINMEAKRLGKRKKALLSDALAAEYSAAIMELPMAAKVIDLGLRDLREGRASAEALVYASFEMTVKEMERLGFGNATAGAIALLAVAADAKLYCVPGHQLRVHELAAFLAESRGEMPYPAMIHDIGKAMFSEAMLKAEEGSFVHTHGFEGIDFGIKKGHIILGEVILEKIGEIEPEAYAKAKPALLSALDHHRYSDFGIPKSTKAANRFADELDATFSFRTYAGRSRSDAMNVLENAGEFVQGRRNETSLARDLAELGFPMDGMLARLQEFNSRFAPELDSLLGEGRTGPSGAMLDEVASKVERVLGIPNSGEHFKSLASAYMLAGKGSKERTVLEHAIGNMMYDIGRRLEGHRLFGQG